MVLKFSKYLKLLMNDQDMQLYFRVHKCEKCGKYTRYIYGEVLCYECFEKMYNNKSIDDIIPKLKYFYNGEIIKVDDMNFGYL